MGINFQEPFLNELKKKKTKVTVRFAGGDTLTGYVKAFDQFIIVIRGEDRDYAVYKSSINCIEPEKDFRIKDA